MKCSLLRSRVRSWRRPAAAIGQWQISAAVGDKPRWSRDGTELFYIAPDGKMMAVPVKPATTGTAFDPGSQC
jgi:hypothetical protein